MSFKADVAAFNERLRQRETHLFAGVVAHVEQSIKVGSPVTSAPGQPVDTGALFNSYQTTFIEPRVAEIASSLAYAVDAEDNPRGATQRSAVGGHHSIRLTRAGFPAIVDYVARNLDAGSPDPSGGGASSGTGRARDSRGRFKKAA